MVILRFLLQFTIGLEFLTIYCYCYQYGQYDDLISQEILMEISIEFKTNSDCVILYSIDKNNNRLLIKTSSQFDIEEKLIINYNEFSYDMEFYKVGGRKSEDGINHLEMNLQFINSSLKVNGKVFNPNGKYENISVENKRKTDNFLNYPNIISKEANRSHLYLGYPNDSQANYPSNLIACINQVKIQNLTILLEERGQNNHVAQKCYKTISESNCTKLNCNFKTKEYYYLECKASINLWPHCYGDLVEYTGDVHSYIKIGQKTSTYITLVWQQQMSKNYSLIEIISKNNYLLSIYISVTNDIVIQFYKDLMYSISIVLDKVSMNNFQSLSMEFSASNIILKTSNGSQIKTFQLTLQGAPTSINLRFFYFNKNDYEIFDGKIAFDFDPRDFQSVRSLSKLLTILSTLDNVPEIRSEGKKQDRRYNNVISQIIVPGLSQWILFSILLLFVKIYKKATKKDKENENDYEIEFDKEDKEIELPTLGTVDQAYSQVQYQTNF